MALEVKLTTNRFIRACRAQQIAWNIRKVIKNPGKVNLKKIQKKVYNHAIRLRGTYAKFMQGLEGAHGLVPDDARELCSFSLSGMPPPPKSELSDAIKAGFDRIGKDAEKIFSKAYFKEAVSASFATIVPMERREDGVKVAVKIPYHNIQNLIESDIKTMKFLAGTTGSRLGLSPGYTKRVLEEISERCKEEGNPRHEAENMYKSFHWYKKLFAGIDNLDKRSKIKRAVKKGIPLGNSEADSQFQSRAEVLEMMHKFHFIHPLPYTEEAGREDLCGPGLFVMDYVPGRDGTKKIEISDPGEEILLKKILAARSEAIGLASVHPHVIVPGDDSSVYYTHSDGHPGNIMLHLSGDAGVCGALVDFGNLQKFRYSESKAMLNIVKAALNIGKHLQAGGDITADLREELAQAYVAADVIDSTTNPAIEKYLLPFILGTNAPYFAPGLFDYGDVGAFHELNSDFYNILYSPTINATGSKFWMHRMMFYHYNNLHRLGVEVDSKSFMNEILTLNELRYAA